MMRRHDMPFGARVVEGGGVRFALWAPAAAKVELCLEAADGEVYIEMPEGQDGWHVVETDMAGPGSLYRYRIDGKLNVPDPASRYQPEGPMGPSMVVDPEEFEWNDGGWKGRPWAEAALYELHVGAYTPGGSFAALADRLDYIAGLGVSAVELMPVASFPGKRGWGYDGVCIFSPYEGYGSPEELKRLIQRAHGHGLMVFLDVVYNHFGPIGNYLGEYAPQFFTGRHVTPWGDAINFDGPQSGTVRDFFIHNALYWIQEYGVDGLRFDSADYLIDDSRPEFLVELAETVRAKLEPGRHVHLVLENDANIASYLKHGEQGRAIFYDAQWNEDMHHVLHLLSTGETVGYFGDYADNPLPSLGRCLAEGFAFQGEASAYRGGGPRGEPTTGLPVTSFVSFIQNHDQVGNRPFGERITRLAGHEAVKAATEIILLAPAPPLIFMGQERGSDTPFLFFCDLGPELSPLVSEGRREMFAEKFHFDDARMLTKMPDPSGERAFTESVLDLSRPCLPGQDEWLDLHKKLLSIRFSEVVPRLPGATVDKACFRVLGRRLLSCEWGLDGGAWLSLLANVGGEPAPCGYAPAGRQIYRSSLEVQGGLLNGYMPAWSVAWFMKP